MLKHLAAAAVLLSALTLSVSADAAGYGSGGSASIMMKPPPGPMMMSPHFAAPAHKARTAKGRVWVDGRGFALYTFGKDAAGRSACYGPCAVAWPPFYAPMGAKGSGPWSIVQRVGLARQWAYNGKPLYFWFKDKRPGQVTGDGVNGFHVAR